MIPDFQKHETVILGGGDYPSHPLPLSKLHNAERIVCCDGAMFELLRHRIQPWRIVGDCDTIFSTQDTDEIRMVETHRHLIRQYSGQDDNDQTKAVRYCMEHGFKDLAIVGATGKREDHTLGNISLLIEYLRMGVNAKIYTDHGIFLPAHDHIEIPVNIPTGFTLTSDTDARRQKSTQISIFNFTAKHLQADGLRYPLSDFTQWWQGTLNEAIKSPVIIEGEGDFLVFLNYE